MQRNFEIGDLPAGNGDSASYGRIAVVDQFHLVVAGAQLQRVLAACFADSMVIHEDVSLFRGSVNGEFAVLSKARQAPANTSSTASVELQETLFLVRMVFPS